MDPAWLQMHRALSSSPAAFISQEQSSARRSFSLLLIAIFLALVFPANTQRCLNRWVYFSPRRPPASNHHLLLLALGAFLRDLLEMKTVGKVSSNWWDCMSPGVTPTPARENQSSFGLSPLGHLEASRLTPRTPACFLPLP